MKTFTCWDESGHEVVYEAATAKDAAQEYVDSGDYYLESKTIWVNVYVRDEDEGEDAVVQNIKIAIHPEDPTSEDEAWVYTGCQGSGGGVASFYRKGDWTKVENSWDYDPQDGVQGLTSVNYTQANN